MARASSSGGNNQHDCRNGDALQDRLAGAVCRQSSAGEAPRECATKKLPGRGPRGDRTQAAAMATAAVSAAGAAWSVDASDRALAPHSWATLESKSTVAKASQPKSSDSGAAQHSSCAGSSVAGAEAARTARKRGISTATMMKRRATCTPDALGVLDPLANMLQTIRKKKESAAGPLVSRARALVRSRHCQTAKTKTPGYSSAQTAKKMPGGCS